ncbi:hypothetical protein BDV39DRAFT_88851 [Aspergillus sergii]|uniref:Uncharacterized protein n=1 Tax=Aspergillus sergii TaxID=1034303 RepID=A0A5N6X0B0_9EURO|nr:hypothetical protein BDV39DRAFT_88851 [Aspergillus sergii]
MDALTAFGVALGNTTTYADRQHFLRVSVLSFTPSIVGFRKAIFHTRVPFLIRPPTSDHHFIGSPIFNGSGQLAHP